MAIHKPAAPTQPTENPAAEAFIDRAPDSQKTKGRGIKKGKKEQVAVLIAPDLLDRIDKAADNMGLSRSALLCMAALQFLQSGLKLKGEP